MRMVLACGLSMPVSMMVVHSRRLARWLVKSRMTRSSSRSFSWPWPTTMRASGTSFSSFSRMFWMVSTSLCRKYTCPPRLSSRSTASRMMPSDRRLTKVLMARRLLGAVAMTEKSRRPSMLIASVRGIGVAVSVSTSTSARMAFRRSFCRTPKRCSSSMMTRPRRLKATSLPISLWVPMTMSILPSANSFSASADSLAVLKRDNSAIFTGQSAKRSQNVW